MTRLPKDSVLPRLAGMYTVKAAHPKFYTKAGWLTPYALACGYLEMRGDPLGDSNARLERLSSAVYRVSVGGRWCRGEADSFHERLAEARATFAKLDHAAINAEIAKASS